jgi:hypothetical protein
MKMTGQEWLLCFQAGRRWDAENLETIAQQAMSISVAPAIRIAAALRFGLTDLVDAAVTDICGNPLNAEGLNLLPSEVLSAIIKAREDLKGEQYIKPPTYYHGESHVGPKSTVTRDLSLVVTHLADSGKWVNLSCEPSAICFHSKSPTTKSSCFAYPFSPVTSFYLFLFFFCLYWMRWLLV